MFALSADIKRHQRQSFARSAALRSFQVQSSKFQVPLSPPLPRFRPQNRERPNPQSLVPRFPPVNVAN